MADDEMTALGDYTLRRKLGSGPYAAVYEAHDGNRICAVKVLDEGAVPDAAGERVGLVRALGALKTLEHTSIVRVFDGGELDGRLFVAMELMQCPTLEQELRSKGAMQEARAVLFVRQVAQALDKTRGLGFFHGNLTPRNLFVVSNQKVKVTDFGVNCFIEEPPEASAYARSRELSSGAATEKEWVSAEDLLRQKGAAVSTGKLDEDFVGLASVLLAMLGVEVPGPEAGQEFEAYREGLRAASYNELTGSEKGVSRQVSEVARRLLTAGEFSSHGEVVVELASAMLLRRPDARRSRPAAAAPVPEPSKEGTSAAEQPEGAGEGELVAEPAEEAVPEGMEPLQFRGDPRTAACTAFFTWDNRRSGKFFVVYEGERIALGRDPEVCDVTLVDTAVSRKHCILSKDSGVIRVEDLGSANGIFINGRKVESGELGPGDSLRVGSTQICMSLVFRS